MAGAHHAWWPEHAVTWLPLHMCSCVCCWSMLLGFTPITCTSVSRGTAALHLCADPVFLLPAAACSMPPLPLCRPHPPAPNGRPPIPPSTFAFDPVLGPSASQSDVYHAAVKPIVEDVLNGCAFDGLLRQTFISIGMQACGCRGHLPLLPLLQ